MLDILGSTVIGLYFIFMVLNFNMKMNDAINTSTQNNMALLDNIHLGQLTEYDFNKIGYRTDSVFVFSKAEETEIEFFGDLDDNGSVDTIRYFLGSDYNIDIYNFNSYSSSGTANPDDIPLYRIVNGIDTTISLVTYFELTYNDANGSEITTSLSTHIARKEIKGVTVNFTIGSHSPVDTVYQEVEWQKRFAPKNI